MTAAASARADNPVRRLIARLRDRPDGELQITINRLILGPLMILYLTAVSPAPQGMDVLLCYVAAGFAALFALLLQQGVSHVRRGVMLGIDLATVSWTLHANGELGATCYPLYLWTIFGYGFRYGLRYLFAAAGISIALFTGTVFATPFWRDLPGLSGALLLALVTLPLYAGALIRRLNNALKDAEAANRAKSYFLASVSHELRTPLTAIIGLSEHIAEAGAGGEDREMAGTIVSAGRGLLSLINQLLDFSRLEAGGVTLKCRPFDLMPLLAEVRGLMCHTAREKGLALTLHVRAGTPLRMEGDDERLRDILINLLGNALKFTAEGAITIVADSVVEADATWLRLAVQDTGIGIAPEAQAKIFGSFVQADDSIIDRFGGTGLGLAICKQLAERLGGRIWVESAPGQGSRFVFTARVTPLELAPQLPSRILLLGRAVSEAERFRVALSPEVAIEPVADTAHLRAAVARGGARTVIVANLADGWPPAIDEAILRANPPVLLCGDDRLGALEVERAAVTAVSPAADLALIRAAVEIAAARSLRPEQASSEEPAAEAAPPQPARRVLVADDNPMNRKVFGMVLGRAGHEVELVDNGEQALDRMKDHGFDVVLMDVNMPVMNGIEATKLYRFVALGRRRVPIVGVTADVSPENVARCLDAGMDACIGKPIDADELTALITSLTSGERPRAEAALPFDPSATVVPLFAPPSTEPDEAVLDPAALDELHALGGEEFVNELFDVYREDAAAMGVRVRRAVDAGDIQDFRDGTHALRSSAANIGATKLAELCRHFQRIAAPEFESRARLHLKALEAELGRVARALDGQRRGPRAGARRG